MSILKTAATIMSIVMVVVVFVVEFYVLSGGR